jgi:diguanylate cyclase (GGDEF)-like protein
MRSLRSKILALAALLVVITQFSTVGAVLLTANQEVSNRADQILHKAAAIAGQLSAGRHTRLRSAGAVLAADPRFINSVNATDIPTINGLLSAHRHRAEIDLVILLDAEGRVLADPESKDATTSRFPELVGRALTAGAAPAHISLHDHTYEVVTLPVGHSAPAVWLTSGVLVEDSFATRMSALTGLDVTLLARTTDRPSILGSSLVDLDRAALLRDLSAADTDGDHALRIRTANTEHVALLLPLVPGQPDIEILLSEPLDAIMGSYRHLRYSVLLLGAIALCLAIVGGLLLSRTITRPVHTLVQAARRIRDGHYHQPVAVQGEGEVAELASAINAMQQSIADREEHITLHARFDSLTGLPTRLSALDEIEAAILRAAPTEQPVTVMLVDLNNFSDIGSSLGQDISDALRCQAAERLRAGLDPRHLLGRIEGDQFVIVLDGRSIDQAIEIAEDLVRLLGGGLSVRDINVVVEARVGIASFPQHASDADQLLQRAAVARNDARNSDVRICVYQTGNDGRSLRQLALLGDLRKAARHDEFRLYLQPKVRLSDGRVCGAEALVRWQHPTFGFLTPDQFIPIAEKSGNISLITNWALATAIRECRLWLEEGLDLPISVNLSSRDLQDKNLPCYVLELLRNHDLPAGNLVLEITEEAVVLDFKHATLILECLRDLGIRIAVDDFGTGYSSLSLIKHLPVDELKIDRSFVTNLPGDTDDVAIVGAAINLAHNLGLQVTAEGVETQGGLEWLAENGCEQAQGFLISKPMPAEQFSAWVKSYVAGDSRRMTSEASAPNPASRTSSENSVPRIGTDCRTSANTVTGSSSRSARQPTLRPVGGTGA